MEITISKQEARCLAQWCREYALRCDTDLTVGGAAGMVNDCLAAGFGPFRCGDADLTDALSDYFRDAADALEAYAATLTEEEAQP